MRFKLRYVILLVVVLATVVAVPLVQKAIRFSREIEGIVVGDVDLSQVADGVHRGTCDVGIVVATVDVTVADGAITAINIVRHDNGKGAPAESIVATVLTKQSLDVNVIAGATYSSRVILKAIENALRGAA